MNRVRGDHTKKKITDTAYQLFREKGYNAVSINDICTTANVAASTLYHHFKSKEDLIEKFLRQPPRVSSSLFAEILAMNTVWEQLWMLVDSTLRHYMSMGPEILKRVIEINLNDDKGTFSDPNAELMEYSVPLVKKGQILGEIRNQSDPVLLISAGNQLNLGLYTRWCIANGGFDLRQELMIRLEAFFDINPEVRFVLQDPDHRIVANYED